MRGMKRLDANSRYIKPGSTGAVDIEARARGSHEIGRAPLWPLTSVRHDLNTKTRLDRIHQWCTMFRNGKEVL